MGVNLKQLIEVQKITLKDLEGKKIGIDAYNWTHQFLSIIRLPTGELLRDSKGQVTSHITGIFNRTINLLKSNIKPCYVWDGEPPEFKRRTIEERTARKEEAKIMLKKAKTAEEVRKYAQQTASLTKDMVKDAQLLLNAMGVPSVQAPSEGEAQISRMVSKNILWGCASQDWDSLLFGASKLIRNLSITGRKKLPRKQEFILIQPELVDLEKVLSSLKITREQLIIMAMLIGTDYCPGINGYGPKKSYNLVKEEKTLDNVLKKVEWNGDIAPHKILDWFMNPKTTDDYLLDWNAVDEEKVLKIMVDKHDFSQERIQSQLNTLTAQKKTKDQTGLTAFFKK